MSSCRRQNKLMMRESEVQIGSSGSIVLRRKALVDRDDHAARPNTIESADLGVCAVTTLDCGKDAFGGSIRCLKKTC